MFEKKGRKRLRRDEHYRPRIIETFRENIFGPLRFKLRKFRSEDFGHYYYELEDSKSGWTCYYSTQAEAHERVKFELNKWTPSKEAIG